MWDRAHPRDRNGLRREEREEEEGQVFTASWQLADVGGEDPAGRMESACSSDPDLKVARDW